jgi:hypothetical protein
MSDALGLNVDFADLLEALTDARVEFIVVGAHALAVHGITRATGDLDVLVRPTATNAERVLLALRAFGAPLVQHGVTEADFAVPGTVYQMGLPPRRIDLLTQISGVDFEEAWQGRAVVSVAGRSIAFLGRGALLKNKRAAARPKDLLDVELLEKQPP